MPSHPRASSVLEAAYIPAIWDASLQLKVTPWFATPKCCLQEPRHKHTEPGLWTHRPFLILFLSSILHAQDSSKFWEAQRLVPAWLFLPSLHRKWPAILLLEYGKGTVVPALPRRPIRVGVGSANRNKGSCQARVMESREKLMENGNHLPRIIHLHIQESKQC